MYYHATPYSNLKQIKKEGLRSEKGRIYLSISGSGSRNFAEDVVMSLGKHKKSPRKWAMLGITLQNLVVSDAQRDPESDVDSYYVLTSRPIPPSHIQFLGTFEVEKLR